MTGLVDESGPRKKIHCTKEYRDVGIEGGERSSI